MALEHFGEKVGFIWSVADLLRGPYRPNQYKDVMLPLTVLRRLDCVLESTKQKDLDRHAKLKGGKVKNLEPILNRVAGQAFHNTSKFTFEKLKGDPEHIAANLTHFIKGFSSRAREIIEHFGFEEHIARLDKADRLYLVVSKFCEIEIRRWIIENDWLEAIVALPDQLFYNTGISTYIWVLTNRKEKQRRGKVQLIDATGFFQKMRKSLGNKRNEIGDTHRDEITRLFGRFRRGKHVRIFDNEDFGCRRITVERPLKLNFAVTPERLEQAKAAKPFVALASSRKRRDSKAAAAEIEAGRELQARILATLEPLKSLGAVKDRDVFRENLASAFKRAGVKVPAPLTKAILGALSERDETAHVCLDAKGHPEPDPELRDYENVPLKEDVDAYMKREVLPHVPEAWVDDGKTKVGYEINFNRYFYQYTPPRPLEDIEADLAGVEREILGLLKGSAT